MRLYELVLQFEDNTLFHVVDEENDEVFFGNGIEVYKNRDMVVGEYRTLWTSKIGCIETMIDELRHKPVVRVKLK